MSGITAAQKRDLRQLAGAGAFTLWLGLYADGSTTEDQALTALVARNGTDLRLAAADLLDGVVDGAATIKRVKVEGELDVEFNPVAYAAKASNLRDQVYRAAGQARRYGPPLAGIVTGRSPVPQAFQLGAENLPPDYERLGVDRGLTDLSTELTGREQP